MFSVLAAHIYTLTHIPFVSIVGTRRQLKVEVEFL